MPLNEGWTFTALVIDLEHAQGQPGEFVACFDETRLAGMGSLVLRTRRSGDFIRPMGMVGRKSLQDLMVDAKIPSELRDRIPIVAFEVGSEVLWVPGRGGRRSLHAPITEVTEGVLRLSFLHS